MKTIKDFENSFNDRNRWKAESLEYRKELIERFNTIIKDSEHEGELKDLLNHIIHSTYTASRNEAMVDCMTEMLNRLRE